MKPQVVIALYEPIKDKKAELLKLVQEHLPALQKYELATMHEGFLAESSSGTIVEVFEWVSNEAAAQAHEHPAIAKIWEKMAQCCRFSRLEELAESKTQFPHFESLRI